MTPDMVRHIKIEHDGVVFNWAMLPLPLGHVLIYVAQDIAYSDAPCAGKQGDPYPYDRVVHLLSPWVSSAAARRIFAEADVRGESVMRSANDAFIRHPDLTSLRVIVWNAEGFVGGQAGLEAFVMKYYPPVPTIEYRTATA